MGFPVLGLGFGVRGLGFRGLGFRGLGWRFGVEGSRLKIYGLRFKVWGSRFRVLYCKSRSQSKCRKGERHMCLENSFRDELSVSALQTFQSNCLRKAPELVRRFYVSAFAPKLVQVESKKLHRHHDNVDRNIMMMWAKKHNFLQCKACSVSSGKPFKH